MKLVIASILVLLVLVGCQNVIDPDTGRVATEHIIGLDTPWNFSEMGFFTAILIYPMAQIINFLSEYVGVTLAIIILTLAIQVLTYRSTVKSTVMTQRMQLIQPEVQKLQEKYKDRTDQQSQMKMGQETQALYKKYDIKNVSRVHSHVDLNASTHRRMAIRTTCRIRLQRITLWLFTSRHTKNGNV